MIGFFPWRRESRRVHRDILRSIKHNRGDWHQHSVGEIKHKKGHRVVLMQAPCCKCLCRRAHLFIKADTNKDHSEIEIRLGLLMRWRLKRAFWWWGSTKAQCSKV